MVASITIRKTYKYRLYRCDKRTKRLHRRIDIAGLIWNHCIALQRRTYRLTGGYISSGKLKKHIAKLRNTRYRHWQMVGSQAVQNVIERLDAAYQRFFKWARTGQGPRVSPPGFKKVKFYRSFTLKQAGWKLVGDNQIDIQGQVYKYVKHRDIPDSVTIKTVTVKRDVANRLWLCFSVIEEIEVQREVSTGRTGGFDFGLKTFLKDQDDQPYAQPGFLRHELRNLKTHNRKLSRKQKGSHNRARARIDLAKCHAYVANKRRDFHFKLAHELCDEYDTLIFEDLNLAGMQRLWGRKVSDLGFGQFIEIVQHVAQKRGVEVVFIDRWEPTSQTCSMCGHRQPMPLRERTFECGACGVVLDRDHNAARNILTAGISAAGLGAVRPVSAGSPV